MTLPIGSSTPTPETRAANDEARLKKTAKQLEGVSRHASTHAMLATSRRLAAALAWLASVAGGSETRIEAPSLSRLRMTDKLRCSAVAGQTHFDRHNAKRCVVANIRTSA